ncbi:MAG: hypothetical protein ACFB4J_05685 [Elainellaceae cyanobacterium]
MALPFSAVSTPALPVLAQSLFCSRRVKSIAIAVLALSLLPGCVPAWLQSKLPAVNAEIEVSKLNAPGRYQVSGVADLPDNTEMGVAALRYLTLTNPVAENPAGRRVYALLDYDVVELTGRTWQAELDLWRVSPEGQFQEGWQGYSDRLDWSVVPDEDVIFLTIPTPTEELAELEQRLRSRQQRLDDSLLRQTFGGDQYAEIASVAAISLPQNTTTEPQPGPLDINGGWGRRYLLQPESPNPNELETPSDRRTTAPPEPGEFLR